MGKNVFAQLNTVNITTLILCSEASTELNKLNKSCLFVLVTQHGPL